eukprot:tig00000178_g12801.t2
MARSSPIERDPPPGRAHFESRPKAREGSGRSRAARKSRQHSINVNSATGAAAAGELEGGRAAQCRCMRSPADMFLVVYDAETA